MSIGLGAEVVTATAFCGFGFLFSLILFSRFVLAALIALRSLSYKIDSNHLLFRRSCASSKTLMRNKFKIYYSNVFFQIVFFKPNIFLLKNSVDQFYFLIVKKNLVFLTST